MSHLVYGRTAHTLGIRERTVMQGLLDTTLRTPLVISALILSTAGSIMAGGTVSRHESDAVTLTLAAFFCSMSDQESYDDLKERFFVTDYSDENRSSKCCPPHSKLLAVMARTDSLLITDGITPARRVGSRITSIAKSGDSLVVSIITDVRALQVPKHQVGTEADGTVSVRVTAESGRPAIGQVYLAKGLLSDIVFVRERGHYRIAKCTGALFMCASAPRHCLEPQLLLYIENVSDLVTPYGAIAIGVSAGQIETADPSLPWRQDFELERP